MAELRVIFNTARSLNQSWKSFTYVYNNALLLVYTYSIIMGGRLMYLSDTYNNHLSLE